MYYVQNPCCLSGLGTGESCEDMQKLAETFQRLSEKPDKKASTRASAAQQADNWRQSYTACMAQRAGVDPATQAAKAAEAQQQIDQAVHGQDSSKSSNVWLYVGVGGAVLLILGALWISGRKG